MIIVLPSKFLRYTYLKDDVEEALTFCSRYLKDDVETRFNRLGRNDDGLPEEEPNKFQLDMKSMQDQ
ncbi:hypothetical protein Tco_1513819, partial [Tanacetum coccineum]